MTNIQISTQDLRDVIASKLEAALSGTIKRAFLDLVAEDIAATIVERASVVAAGPAQPTGDESIITDIRPLHTYATCSHRPDFASETQHDRECPAMERAFDEPPAYQPKEI